MFLLCAKYGKKMSARILLYYNNPYHWKNIYLGSITPYPNAIEKIG